jgi:hypothetical protein
VRFVIVGDSVARPGVASRWNALAWSTTPVAFPEYEWTRIYRAAGSTPRIVGRAAMLGLADNTRNCLLTVTVRHAEGTSVATHAVRIEGAPSVRVDGPAALAPGEWGSLRASAGDGIAPYAWRWMRGCAETTCVIGREATLSVRGETRPFDLYVVAVSANRAESDPVAVRVDTVSRPALLGGFGVRALDNPASGGTVRVMFALPAPGTASLEVLDVRGRRVARERGMFDVGTHTVTLARGLRRGIYLVRLTHGGRSVTCKAVVGH